MDPQETTFWKRLSRETGGGRQLMLGLDSSIREHVDMLSGIMLTVHDSWLQYSIIQLDYISSS